MNMCDVNMASTVHFSQINLQKSVAGSTELNNREDQVVFITEPYTFHGKVLKLNRSNTSVLHAGKDSPRAALRISKDLNPWLVPEFSSSDMCTATVKIDNRQVFVCSLYLDINLDVKPPQLVELIERCNEAQAPLIVGADTNAHSTLWGCRESNLRGEGLEALLLSKNMLVLNSGSVPTFVTSRAESIIDVTMVNCAALEQLKVQDWEVDRSFSGSDHRYVSYTVGKYVPYSQQYRNLKKADWELFRGALEVGELPEIEESGSNFESCAEALQKLVQESLDKACPLKPALKRPPNPWWNSELDDLRKELKRAHGKRKQNDECWESFIALKRRYKNAIITANRETWRQFCTKAETIGDISKVVKAIRPKPSKGVSLFSSQGKTLTPKETLGNLMDAHFIDSVPAGDMEGEKATTIRHVEDETMNFVEYIEPSKVKHALNSFGPHKAAGPDGLKPIVLQNLNSGCLQYISELYKLAVVTGQAPKVWRKMSVVFLPKEGKSDYGTAKSYRPITLSNFILKGLERLIQWYLNENVTTEPLYAQHAYTKGRSCDTAVSEAVDYIERNSLRGNHVLAVSLDCSGAFDRITFESARQTMLEKLVPSGIIHLYMSILKGRWVTAKLQGETETRKPRRGSPQGGVLSPLIWILIMDTILRTFRHSNVKVVGYADDILLMVSGKDGGVLVDIMNRELKKIIKWGSDNGLIFNPTKTCVVRFTQNNRLKPWKKVKMDGSEMEYEKEMRYLGVTLHRQLTWTAHCKNRVAKAVKTINLANAAIGQKWGFSPEKVHWVYTILARSVATYGALVWAPGINTTIFNMLNRLQRKALLGMTSSMRSTPTQGLEAIMGMIPLDLHVGRLSLMARWRTRPTQPNTWDGRGQGKKKGHRRHHDALLQEIGLINQEEYDHEPMQRIWIENDTVENPDLTLYTDGSHINNMTGSGWAACCGDTVIAEEMIHLGETQTVFQAEVVAIEHALKWVEENCDAETEILIRSDSQAAIQAIFKPENTTKVVNSCKKLLKQAKENQRIAIQWIKGHADHTGNELADYLAKEGSNNLEGTIQRSTPTPKTEVTRAIKNHFLKTWQDRWDGETTCRQTKNFFSRMDEGKLKKLAKWSRNKLNLLVQVGSGHALTAGHTSQWTGLGDTCKLCTEAPETVEHLFYECPALEQHRREVQELCSKHELNLEAQLVEFFTNNKLMRLFESRSRGADEMRRLRLTTQALAPNTSS